MASTSVYLPMELVERLDRLAARWGTSRNRVILQACEALLDKQQGEWSPDFFDSPLSKDELALLRDAGEEMEAVIYAARRDRAVPHL